MLVKFQIFKMTIPSAVEGLGKSVFSLLEEEENRFSDTGSLDTHHMPPWDLVTSTVKTLKCV